MKQIKKIVCVLMVSSGMLIASCGSEGSSNEESGDSIKTSDSTLQNASENNNFPNERMPLTDSSSGSDSTAKDTIKK